MKSALYIAKITVYHLDVHFLHNLPMTIETQPLQEVVSLDTFLYRSCQVLALPFGRTCCQNGFLIFLFTSVTGVTLCSLGATKAGQKNPGHARLDWRRLRVRESALPYIAVHAPSVALGLHLYVMRETSPKTRTPDSCSSRHCNILRILGETDNLTSSSFE